MIKNSSIACILIVYSQALWGSEMNNAQANMTRMFATLEACKMLSPEMSKHVLRVQFPLLIVSASVFGQDKTHLILETYPKLVNRYLSNPEQSKRITDSLCAQSVEFSSNIVSRYIQKYGSEPVPSWLLTNEFKSLFEKYSSLP